MDTQPIESKAVRLARYLKEFVGLRSTTVYDVHKYDSVLWFSDIPQEPQCQSPAWSDGFEPGEPWLTVHKQQFPKPPAPPDEILPWIEEQALRRASAEMPSLRPTRLEPDPTATVEDGEEPPLIEVKLEDHPEVIAAFERFYPSWEAWSAEYMRRDRIQSVYAELFRLHTQVRKQGEILELVLGLGLLDWRDNSKGASPLIQRHMVTARVDLLFDTTTGIIQLNGAADGVQLRVEDDMLDAELRPERGQYAAVSEQLSAIDDDVWDRQRIFTALKSWATALHPDCEWSAELKPSIGEIAKPRVTFAPALILRKRTQVGMVRIYDAIISRLAAGDEDIPAGWTGLIDDEDDGDHEQHSGGLHAPDESSPEPRLDAQEVYFPLPANREQRRIVEAITNRRGVLVQGPPGTGKSHTIANLVCHLLATGKRVLITAETGRALNVLKEKLPADIQPLCVSVLGQGGDAFAELNASVQGITSRFATWSPGAYDSRITEIDGELASVRRSLAKTDFELRSLREEETYPHTLMNGAYAGTASAIARRVALERERFGWLQVPLEGADDPPVRQEEIEQWLNIRRHRDTASADRSRLRMVGTDALPAPEEFAFAVGAEREANSALERLTSLRVHLAYQPIVALPSEARKQLAEGLRKMNDRRKRLLRLGDDWVPRAVTSALEGRQARWQALLDQSRELFQKADEILEKLGSASVSIPEEKDRKVARADAAAVMEHLRAGGKWTSFGVLTPKAVKDRTYLREAVTVDGQSAATPDTLQVVCDYLDLTFAFEGMELAWSDHGGLPTGSQPRIRLAAIREHIDCLDRALLYAADCNTFGRALNGAVLAIPEPDWLGDDVEEWLDIIDASSVEERHREATERTTACLSELKAVRQLHDAHPVVATLVQSVEQRDITGYSQSYEVVLGIERTRRDEQLLAQVDAALRVAVPGLSECVTANLADKAWDDRFGEWEASWRWAVAENWLRKRSDVSYRERLWQRRKETDSAINALLGEAAALHAWTYFFNRLSHTETAALKSWREAVRAIGRGTGRSARIERLRREARQYMDQCREAIPIWIMPRYLVAEMIDPTPGRYDLVIVDEASQLGIESLFLFYVAKKLVVVGDDQQISPYGIGIADEAIANLQHHYLEGVPHHHALSAQSSFYANAKIRFGQNIVLREHFRCMPEIIQFSNDLCYASNGTPLDPLRAYPANRLRPLVVRHVAEGYRTGSTQNALNEPEADALVAQVVACIADPRYEGRTMGVISLQGEAQAKLIEHKLLETLEPEVIEQRRLICGDAYAFQGDEREIIFLSMVAAPGATRIGALTNDAARQRFNVAASRAQDQLWLFHTATLDVLSPACMRYHLLRYMLNPGRLVTEAAGQKFDSQFERDIFDLIVAKGFHVRTQVCVGDPANHRYRIDLVVEGMQGRLAVECDGDEWHGPDRYEQDMARQRDLERAGWQFVRIRGSEFYRDPGKAITPLWAELDYLGIKPGGIDEAAAEPPPPVELEAMERREVDEVIVSEAASTPQDAESDTASSPSTTLGHHVSEREHRDSPTHPDVMRASNPSLADYVPFQGQAGPDPRTVSLGAVSEGLCRIIEAEGPMMAKRAYDIYLRGCGIRRLGPELKSTMNKALSTAIRQGQVISENEPGVSGLLFSTVRSQGSPPVLLRCRGPRTFEEIPPAELRSAGRHLCETLRLESGTDEHLRAILEYFDLKRLTAQVGTTLLEILGRPEASATPLLDKVASN
jgi:very-short-patch-repair endonuclease